MKYDVITTAEGAPLDQLNAATSKFRLVLESRIGGKDRFKACFLAHGKRNSDASSMTPTEIADAELYAEASLAAENAAKQILNRQDVGFMVRLGLPVH